MKLLRLSAAQQKALNGLTGEWKTADELETRPNTANTLVRRGHAVSRPMTPIEERYMGQFQYKLRKKP